ncbi:MAG: 4a-hydroxytetrahydrobiopterin dehydratase [Nitriliruptoraceae bacterium]|nr:4a-hydroxytetrahydrobiopterin dehydratase [Nitriliruptoraceae bacterium]
MNTLDDDTIRTALEDLEGWERRDQAIHRSFSFDGFREAIAFINRVADLADAADHHPELANVYASVDITLTTHDAGGITQKDVALARAINDVV